MRMYSTVAHLRSSAVKERKETRWKTETVMVQVERVLVLFFFLLGANGLLNPLFLWRFS